MSEFRRFYRQTYLDQLGVIRKPPAQDPAILPYWGAPTWRDEFDTVDPRTPSGVNPDLWRVWDGQTLGAPRQEFLTGRPQNLHVANGCLNMVAIRETGVRALNGTVQDANHPWTSSYIDTWQKQAQKYGRWEIRMQLNTHATGTRGVWPAWWMRPASWLPLNGVDGEIDMMEAWGGQWATSGYRLGSAQWTLWQNETSTAAKVSNWLTTANNSPDLAVGFHTYAFEWTPTSMKQYVDDVLMMNVNTVDSTKPWLQSSFNAPFYPKLQVQMGQTYWGLPDSTTVSPTDPFKVDYVRYYAYPGA
jgi:beta-glucanase (GH16 family)